MERRSTGGMTSELGADGAGWLEGKGDVNERGVECLLRLFDGPEGDVLRVKDVTERDTPSSVSSTLT